MTARLLGTVIVAALLAGCGGGTAAPAGRDPDATLSGTLTVFAAASLTETLTAEARAFEASHPRVRVETSFGASSTLAMQLEQGAAADVFAAADRPSMDRVERAGLLAGPPAVFARNRLELAVAPGNPRRVRGLSDLGRSDLKVVLCQADVPCGRYSKEALGKAGVRLTPVSEEIDVKSVLGRVEQGEADAGIVYATDVFGAGARVSGVAIPDAENVIAEYPVGLLRAGRDVLAARFREFLLSEPGRAILRAHKFGA